MKTSTRLMTISLRDFAVPVPRSGSIEAQSGYGRAAAEGQAIHARLQRMRKKADPHYQAEVPVACQFTRGGYDFRVDGRMDGLFQHDPPRIEEIKSSFQVAELARRLEDEPMMHPYGLQLLTYGYFYWRRHHVLPNLGFHLVSFRGDASMNLRISLDLPLYETWLDARLDELVVQAERVRRRTARRRKIASALVFPFSRPRPGQVDLMREVEAGLAAAEPMLLQAPTGLGKTTGVLYPVLKEGLGRGQQLVYVTPKNSQHAIAEEAIDRFLEAGSRIRSLSLTAKAKICLKEEPLCSPEYCEYARDYYTKVEAHGLADILAKKRKLTFRTFRRLGERYQVCPFELQIEGVREADIVIGDYNYVFAPRSALQRAVDLRVDQGGKPNLVIDEAHNLPGRAMDDYSSQLASVDLERMRDDIRSLAPPFRREAERLLDGCIETVLGCAGQRTTPGRIAPPVKPFLEQDGRIRSFLTRYLEADTEIRRRDVILRLSFYWSAFTQNLEHAADPERREFFVTWHPLPGGAAVKVSCCDASAMLTECYGDYQQVVGFSATLKPFEYYIRLSGMNGEVRTAEFVSPFPPERRKILIIPQISTRYSRRQRHYGKIAEAVQRITALRRGNYFVFFPSFEFLDEVAALLRPADGFAVLRQERTMKAAAVREVLETLRRGSPTIVLAVQGGSFAEGLDYAGEMVIGAFVVGPPLPSYDLEREQMRNYYHRRYGAGFDYAYVIPAMARAVQAAGRVIRSETDRGLIVLLDSRFAEWEYARAMPGDWFDNDPAQLVSTRILDAIDTFWRQA